MNIYEAIKSRRPFRRGIGRYWTSIAEREPGHIALVYEDGSAKFLTREDLKADDYELKRELVEGYVHKNYLSTVRGSDSDVYVREVL